VAFLSLRRGRNRKACPCPVCTVPATRRFGADRAFGVPVASRLRNRCRYREVPTSGRFAMVLGCLGTARRAEGQRAMSCAARRLSTVLLALALVVFSVNSGRRDELATIHLDATARLNLPARTQGAVYGRRRLRCLGARLADLQSLSRYYERSTPKSEGV
jgi:hypothetical protein